MQKATGILLIIGTLLFGIGEIMLVSKFEYGEPQLMIQSINNDPTGWLLTMVIWGAGSAILALSLVLFALQIRSVSNNRNARIASYVAAALAVIGCLAWLIRCYNAITMAPEEVIGGSTALFNTLFLTYSILTQIALIITGFVLLRGGYPKWLGWVVLVFGGLLLGNSVLLGGGPPGLNNIPFLVMGIALLLRSRPPQPLPLTT